MIDSAGFVSKVLISNIMSLSIGCNVSILKPSSIAGTEIHDKTGNKVRHTIIAPGSQCYHTHSRCVFHEQPECWHDLLNVEAFLRDVSSVIISYQT